MRVETKKVVKAFIERRSAHGKNSWTDGNAIYLFKNKIAWRDHAGDIYMTCAGWNTVTTRERLNGLCEMVIGKRPYHQKNHELYFDDREIFATDTITIHEIKLVELDLAA